MTFQCKDIPECMALQAIEDSRDDGAQHVPAYRLIMQRTGAPEKVVFRKLERLESRGYLEYGTNIGWAWLTAAGAKRLVEIGGVIKSRYSRERLEKIPIHEGSE